MSKWFLTLFVTVIVAGFAWPRLSRLFDRLRLPGDVVLRFRGQTYHFPFASALVFSLLAMAVARWL